VFRTESKDYLEAFSKIEAFIKSNNSNAGSSISKESTNKINVVNWSYLKLNK
jgi:hypothetical protein